MAAGERADHRPDRDHRACDGRSSARMGRLAVVTLDSRVARGRENGRRLRKDRGRHVNGMSRCVRGPVIDGTDFSRNRILAPIRETSIGLVSGWALAFLPRSRELTCTSSRALTVPVVDLARKLAQTTLPTMDRARADRSVAHFDRALSDIAACTGQDAGQVDHQLVLAGI